MKKVILVLALLLLQFAYAEDFSGYKYQGDTFTLNDDNFSIQLSKDWGTIYLKYNDKSLIIDNGSCEQTDLKYYTICFRGAVVDFHNDIGKLHDRTGETMPGLNLTFTYQKPEITLSRSISKTDPLLWEIIDITVTIENTGKNPAQVAYTDPIPTGFETTPSSGVGFNGRQITYSTNLGLGAKRQFSYKLKPLKHLSAEMTGNLSYVYEGFSGVLSNTKTTIETKDTVTLTTNAPGTMNVAEKGELEIILNNIDGATSASVDISIEVPGDLIVSTVSGGLNEVEEQRYAYSFHLPKLGQERIVITFNTIKTGNYTIPVFMNYSLHDVEKTLGKNVSIKVTSDKLNPSLVVSDSFISSNQRFTLTGRIVNNDKDTPYYSITAEVDSVFLEENFAILKIIQNMDMTVFEREIIAPTMEEKTDFTIDFSGTYKTENNEEFSFSTSKTITVSPPSAMIKIHHELDKYTTDEDKAKVIVYVENTQDRRITNVNVSEEIHDVMNVIAGKTQILMTLEPKKKSQAYYYTVQALDNTTENNEIITSVKYTETDREFVVRQSLTLDIVGKGIENKGVSSELTEGEYDVIEEETEDEQGGAGAVQDNQQDASEQEEKKSFWQKIVDFFKNLI